LLWAGFKPAHPFISAQAGIQYFQRFGFRCAQVFHMLDPRLRGDERKKAHSARIVVPMQTDLLFRKPIPQTRNARP
jgi:hypothetical protein